MHSAIHIGGPNPESVREARETILGILKSNQDQATQQKALDVLQSLCQGPSNSTISGCSFEVNETKRRK